LTHAYGNRYENKSDKNPYNREENTEKLVLYPQVNQELGNSGHMKGLPLKIGVSGEKGSLKMIHYPQLHQGIPNCLNRRLNITQGKTHFTYTLR
jgi:hypothetical protein